MKLSHVAGAQAAVEPATGGGRGRILDLGLLYASKSGAIVVGLLILPLFNRMLGAEQFGVVALIISLQAFLVVLDFGMSAMVGRDLAVADATSAERYATWREAEAAITLIYSALTPLALLVALVRWGPQAAGNVLGCMALFWSLTLQNIGQSALLARHRFPEAAAIQVLGVLARNGIAAVALAWISPTLSCFIISQAVLAVAQMLATRWRCIIALRLDTSGVARGHLLHRALTLLRKGQPLMLFGLAGAAAMQLDKVMVSSFISTRDLAPYFLAVTFCLTPLSVLAAPVAQFFQPRLIGTVSAADSEAIRRTLRQFILCMTVCALIPTAVLWLLRDPLIAVWLHHSSSAGLVARYSAVLLPGVAVGALGYVPYTMLISNRDYQFQARFSLALTTITLSAVLIAAFRGSVLPICVIYALYHSSSTVGSWWRCIRLDICGGGSARHSALQATIMTCLVAGSAGCVAALTAGHGFLR